MIQQAQAQMMTYPIHMLVTITFLFSRLASDRAVAICLAPVQPVDGTSTISVCRSTEFHVFNLPNG